MRRDGLVTRRPSRRVTPSFVEQILAFGPAQWIRFTSEYVTLNGSDISAAADLSPNARNVTQGTSTAQPAFANPGANFDGTDDALVTAAAFLTGTAGFSVFAVVDLAGETLTGAPIYGSDGANYCYLDHTASATRIEFSTNAGNRTANSGINRNGATGRFLFDSRAVSGSIRVWDNGTQGVEATGAFASLTTAGAPLVGASSALKLYPGTIQDVIVFTPALSLADQAAVRALLAQLDGVTL